MFRRQRLREYLRRFERPIVLLAGVKGHPSYQGVVLEAFDDAFLLANWRLAEETDKGEVKWHAGQGSVVVDRAHVAHVQLLDSLALERHHL